jgi:plasmid stability protein
MSLSHRLQILLDEEQYARLTQRAKAEGRSVGALIREAVDHMWTGTDVRKAALLDAILADGPMPVPDPKDLALELDELRGSRFPAA